MRIAVPREIMPDEKRVATVPEVVEKLIKLGFKVAVESGAGDAANFSDDSYRAVGADIVVGAAKLWAESDIVFKVAVPTSAEVGLMREGGTLIGFVWPAQNPELMQQLAAKKATVLSMDCLPRMLRADGVDEKKLSWVDQVWGSFGYSEPSSLVDIKDSIIHFHGKFFTIENGDEPDLRYEEVVKTLLEIGYTGNRGTAHGAAVKLHRGCEACHAAPFCTRCHGVVPKLNFDPALKLVK